MFSAPIKLPLTKLLTNFSRAISVLQQKNLMFGSFVLDCHLINIIGLIFSTGYRLTYLEWTNSVYTDTMLLEWSQPVEGSYLRIEILFLSRLIFSRWWSGLNDVIEWDIELIHVRDVGEWVFGIVILIHTLCIIIVS